MGELTLHDPPEKIYRNGVTKSRTPGRKVIPMNAQTIVLLVIGAILLTALLLLLGTGAGMGGMAMMAGMMATPIGWVVLLIILALGGFMAWAFLFAH
jgi:hypothetical protein